MGQVLGFPGVDPDDAAVGARLRRWREARGMAVEDLARLMDVTPEEERRVEAGRAHLNSVKQGVATRALRLPIWALASDTRAH
jgi:transcriptional regulator with XRE-family HTH domain